MERPRSNNDQACLEIQEIQNWFTNNSIHYRVVGGLAVGSYTNQSTDNSEARPLNFYGSDVDLLIKRADYSEIKEHILDKPGSSKGTVRFDLTSSKYIDYRPGAESSFLVFRDIRTPISSALFEARENYIDGLKIKTIPAATLFHTFSVCGGTLRPKDWKQLLSLGRYLRRAPDLSFKESDYENFHTFLDMRKCLYPRDIAFLARVQIVLSYLPPLFDDISWKTRGMLLKRYF